MTHESGHRPTQRLVPRPVRGAMPDENLFEAADRAEHEATPGDLTSPADDSIDARFEAWIERNPQVLDLFIRLARDWKAAGQTRAGGKMFAEVLRYHSVIEGMQVQRDPEEAFKINNVYVSRLTRLAVQQAPDLEGLFLFRELTSLRSA
jgi:hypothetical protein